MNPLEGARVVLLANPECDCTMLREALDRWACIVCPTGSLEQLRAALEADPVDLILLRLCNCFPEHRDVFFLAREGRWPPIVTVTGCLDVGLYLEAMRCGAFDCVALPLDEKELERIALRALESRRARAAN